MCSWSKDQYIKWTQMHLFSERSIHHSWKNHNNDLLNEHYLWNMICTFTFQKWIINPFKWYFKMCLLWGDPFFIFSESSWWSRPYHIISYHITSYHIMICNTCVGGHIVISQFTMLDKIKLISIKIAWITPRILMKITTSFGTNTLL